MDNSIYQETVKFLNASTAQEQSVIVNNINSLIDNALKNKQNQTISEAILLAENNNNFNALNFIQFKINEHTTIFNYKVNGINKKSYLLIIPFLVLSDQANINLPSLSYLENLFRNLFVNFEFNDFATENFNLAPVLLGKNSAYNMNMSDWYQIHRANSLNLDKRNQRAMYSQNFQIQLEPNIPQLSFFAATINLPENNSIPSIFNINDSKMEQVLNLLTQLQSVLSQEIPNTFWTVMPPGNVNETIANSFDLYQNTLVNIFIKKYSFNKQVEFILIPTNDKSSLALLAWNKPKNTVVDLIILNPYSKNLSIIIDEISSIMANEDVVAIYVGDENKNFNDFKNLGKIDIKDYLRKFGASVLKTM
jgi:hypothetical protein